MQRIIKLQFIKGGKAFGREYAYYTPVDVVVGDMVDAETAHGVMVGRVTQINVPEAEIAPFKDKAKSIIGKTKICCELCFFVTPTGEGDHICDQNPLKLVIEKYKPTDDYLWCKGESFQK